MVSAARIGLLAAVLVTAVRAGAPADCPPGQGQRVVLAADGANPDVFVWDSRERLARYVSGTWSTTRDVMQHTMLVPAGTPAVVTQCRAGDVRVQYQAAPSDVFAVRLIGGPHANRYGWVVGSDVHLERRPLGSPPSPHRNSGS
jgi:hypothetical protein